MGDSQDRVRPSSVVVPASIDTAMPPTPDEAVRARFEQLIREDAVRSDPEVLAETTTEKARKEDPDDEALSERSTDENADRSAQMAVAMPVMVPPLPDVSEDALSQAVSRKASRALLPTGDGDLQRMSTPQDQDLTVVKPAPIPLPDLERPTEVAPEMESGAAQVSGPGPATLGWRPIPVHPEGALSEARSSSGAEANSAHAVAGPGTAMTGHAMSKAASTVVVDVGDAAVGQLAPALGPGREQLVTVQAASSPDHAQDRPVPPALPVASRPSSDGSSLSIPSATPSDAAEERSSDIPRGSVESEGDVFEALDGEIPSSPPSSLIAVHTPSPVPSPSAVVQTEASRSLDSGVITGWLQNAIASLQVAEGAQGARQVHLEIKPEILPGVRVVLQEVQGRVQVDFICSVQASHQVLGAIAQREAADMARRCRRDLVLRIQVDDKDPDREMLADVRTIEVVGTA